MQRPSPSQLQSWFQSALADISSGALDRAEATLRRLVQAAPRAPEPAFQLARVLHLSGHSPDALPFLEIAQKLRPDEPNIARLAAEIHERLGNTDAALAAHDTLVRLAPGDLRTAVDKAVFLQRAGRFDEAEALFRKLLKKHPNEGQLYRIFLATKKLSRGDPLIAAMQRALRHPKQTDAGRMHLGYALAKAMDDIGAPERMFQPLHLANRLQARAYPFDRAAREAEIEGVLAAQDPLPEALPASDERPTPIYVCGMPRSGTTLVERVLAAHPDVTAGGEMGHALRHAYARFGAGARMQPVAAQGPEALARFASDVRQSLRRATSATTRCVTDKSIATDLVFGLLATALPDARFIVVRRDPHAIALSIYRNFFAEGTHRYANDLSDIAWMIHRFHRTIDVWKRRMPDRIHEIRYEDLVRDPEPQSRALVAAAGLDWNDACLAPHKTQSRVQTLSLYQVRQPIKADRTEAWRMYEADLAPFTEAWDALQ